MPQVQAQMPDLSQMFGQQTGLGTLAGMHQYNQAMTTNKQNLIQAQQAMEMEKKRLAMEQQAQPGKLEEMAARAAATRAQIPLFGEQVREKQMTNDVTAAVPKEDRISAVVAKMAREKSENELKSQEDQINTMISNPQLPEDVRRRLLQMRDLFPQIYAEQKKQALVNKGNLDIAEAGERRAIEVANIGANATRYAADKGAASREAVAKTRLSTTQSPKTAEAMSIALRNEAMKTQDPARKAELLEEANMWMVEAQKLKQASAVAQPKVDVGKEAGVATTPGGPPGSNIGRPNAGAPTRANADLQKAIVGSGWAWEPDKYDYRIGPNGVPQRKPK